MLPFLLLFIASILAYAINRRAALSLRQRAGHMHSSPGYHGSFAALSVFIPLLILVLAALFLKNMVVEYLVMSNLPAGVLNGLETGQINLILAEIKSLSAGRVFGEPDAWKLSAAEQMVTLHGIHQNILIIAVVVIAVTILLFRLRKIDVELRARQGTEQLVHRVMVFCSVVAVLTTIGIVAALLFETIKFFNKVPIADFLFGLNWEPQIPIREGQIAAEGAFGWLPVLLGTLLVTAVALLVAVPTGLFAAVYLNEFAPRAFRAVAKPMLEILAGVPTIVYGFFAILVIAPSLRSFGAIIGLDVAPNSALAAGAVMGVMLIPFIASFADDAISAVPGSLRDGALALGSTRSEAMMQVQFPAAIPGIVGGVLLAVSRAIGETMIVVMAAGLIARMTLNPLDSVTTVTVQIVTLLIGDTSFDNPKTLAAFALGMMLFLVTLLINICAIRIVHKYREAYD